MTAERPTQQPDLGADVWDAVFRDSYRVIYLFPKGAVCLFLSIT